MKEGSTLIQLTQVQTSAKAAILIESPKIDPISISNSERKIQINYFKKEQNTYADRYSQLNFTKIEAKREEESWKKREKEKQRERKKLK